MATTKSNGGAGDRPKWPYPHIVKMHAHATGQWAKNIAGRRVYFGTWRNPERALKRWEAMQFAQASPVGPLEGLVQEYLDLYGVPVVYFLLKAQHVVYVGQTTNLPERIVWHRRKNKAFDTVKYIQVEESALRDVERAFIVAFFPHHNQTKDGDAISCSQQHAEILEAYLGRRQARKLLRRTLKKSQYRKVVGFNT